jgi:DNA-binding GntR family transcriptional regulator
MTQRAASKLDLKKGEAGGPRPAGTAAAAGPKAARRDLAYLGVRRAIIEQALLPGTKLPEDAIGASFGVSRSLVRTALARLAAEGLVELRPNRGAVVASPTLAEAQDVFAVRRHLEDLVVETLCGRLTAVQAARLRQHVGREKTAHGRDGPESIRLAGEFHLILAEFTGNELLRRYIGEVVSRCSLILALYGRVHSSDCAVEEHTQLIEALLAGEVRPARRLMEAHLQAIQDRAVLSPPNASARGLRDVLGAYGEALGAARESP